MPLVDEFELCGTTLVGSYVVEAVVAEGGFGVVYRAHHTGFKASVALKCLKVPQDLAAEHQVAFRAQFQAEAELLFHLSAATPHVVRPLHVDAVKAPNGRFMPFMVLEWLEGETVDAYAMGLGERAPVHRLLELVRLLTPAAEALAIAHAFPSDAGTIAITHCDIKPENLFIAQVAGQPQVKVLDFGIARARNAASQAAGRATENASGLVAFSPAYAAPEQWIPLRLGQTGPWTDVWGMALCLVELLLGEPPLTGDKMQLMAAALDPLRRPTPEASGVALPAAVERVFALALAVDPRDRYRDISSFWSALQQTLSAVNEETPTAAFPSELNFDDVVPAMSAPPPLGFGAPPPGAGRAAEPRGTAEQATRVESAAAPRRSVRQGGPARRQGPLEPPRAPGDDSPSIAIPLAPNTSPIWHDCFVPALSVACGAGLALMGELYAKRTGEVFALLELLPLSWVTASAVIGGAGLVTLRLSRRLLLRR